MILPPILSTNGLHLKEALEDYLGVQCVRSVIYEERCTYVTFLNVPATDKLKEFVKHLSDEVVFTYQGNDYVITSQYLDL